MLSNENLFVQLAGSITSSYQVVGTFMTCIGSDESLTPYPVVSHSKHSPAPLKTYPTHPITETDHLSHVNIENV